VTPHPEGHHDAYGASAIRERVLATWAASPARFREDANAEEDLALGGYRDRVVVELAQNAADAATRAGVPGRLRLRLADGTLTATNTGDPLDAAGVQALSTLRASAKRDSDASVGRFGVGFAAVLAVTDEPRIASAAGAVRWSRADTRAAVARVPALAEELDARGGHVPVLRLPWEAPGEPVGADFATVVTLPLRDDAAEELVRRLLDEVDDTLLLALPALAAVEVEVDGVRRAVTGVDARWHVVRRSGRLEARLLADRPTEERARRAWSLTWALPRDSTVERPKVLLAPTPTDEPLDLPALLIAAFPLDPSRRHVAPGPLTDELVLRCAEAYAELVQEHPDPRRIPGSAPAGALDGALRRAIRERLAETPFLPVLGEEGVRVRPRDAVLVEGLDEELGVLLGPVLPGLVGPPWSRARELPALGARTLTIADVADALAGLAQPPSWWRELYAALAGADRDALGALPVPLADGRLARGPRGLLLPAEDLGHVEALNVRMVHPEATHPLLERLGAAPVTAREVLERVEPEELLDAAWGGDDTVTDSVLTLVAAAGGSPAWLGDLPLPDETGEPAAARDLVLPGSTLARLVADPLAPHPDVLARWGRDVLAAAGVGDRLTVLRDEDVVADDDCDHDLPDEDVWVDELREALPADFPPVLPELVAVRDLDLVRDDAWPELLVTLAADPELRAAVLEPARLVVTETGARADVPSYTAWWLRRHARIDGRRPTDLRTEDADAALDGLYDPVALPVDRAVLRAVGVRTALAELVADPDGAADVLDRLADPGRVVSRAQLRELYAALAGADPALVSPPAAVRVAAGEGTAVVDADEAEVLDAPQWLQLAPARAQLVVTGSLAADLADVLDLPCSSERPAPVESVGAATPVPDVVRRVLPGAAGTWLAHDDLRVVGESVQWWVDGEGVHASTLDGLARGLAWAAGDWPRRHLVAALLADPDDAPRLVAEAELE
jgi:hypothetical protein